MQCFLIVSLVLLAEKVKGILVVDIHGIPHRLAFLFLRGEPGFKVIGIDIGAILPQEKLDGIDKTESLVILNEADDITTFVTTKTFVHVQRRVEHQ